VQVEDQDGGGGHALAALHVGYAPVDVLCLGGGGDRGQEGDRSIAGRSEAHDSLPGSWGTRGGLVLRGREDSAAASTNVTTPLRPYNRLVAAAAGPTGRRPLSRPRPHRPPAPACRR